MPNAALLGGVPAGAGRMIDDGGSGLEPECEVMLDRKHVADETKMQKTKRMTQMKLERCEPAVAIGTAWESYLLVLSDGYG
jgi:hypothetical protein